MANLTDTACSMNTTVGYNDIEVRDELLTLAGADTLAAGTILARDSVSEKLVIYVKGGSTNQNGIPKAVLREALTVTGAGDSTVPVMVTGSILMSDLIIDADADNSNIDQPVKDQLREYGIIAIEGAKQLT